MILRSQYIIALCFTLLISIALGESKKTSDTEAGTRIVQHESVGNLEVTHPVGCEDISGLQRSYTPPDIYRFHFKKSQKTRNRYIFAEQSPRRD